MRFAQQLLCLFVGISSNSVQAAPYFQYKDWSVFRNEQNCVLAAIYEDKSKFLVVYDIGLNDATIFIIDPAFKSVTSEKKYRLRLLFDKPSGLETGWGEVDISGVEVGGEKAIQFKMDGHDALDDIAASEYIAWFRDKDVVVSLTLAGSAPAVAKLRQCAKEVNRLNPSDPLDGAEIKK